MKFSKNYKPGTVFFNLFFEILKLRSPESEPISISLKEGMSVPPSEEVPDSISDKRSDNRETDHIDKLNLAEFPEKTSDEKHDLLPGNEYPDDRKRLDDTTRECNQIVPISENVDLFFHPSDKLFNERWFKNSNRRERKDKAPKKKIQDCKEEMDYFFLHSEMVSVIIKHNCQSDRKYPRRQCRRAIY